MILHTNIKFMIPFAVNDKKLFTAKELSSMYIQLNGKRGLLTTKYKITKNMYKFEKLFSVEPNAYRNYIEDGMLVYEYVIPQKELYKLTTIHKFGIRGMTKSEIIRNAVFWGNESLALFI